MCDQVVFKAPFILKYCLDIKKTQEICDQAVDASLNFVRDWFVTSKMLEKLDENVLSNDDTDLCDIDSDITTFFNP